jgi:hypothetical protein
MRVIGIHFGVEDRAVLTDHVASRHRKCPARIVVERGQIVLETLVKLDQIVGQLETQAEGGADLALCIRQNPKRELVLAQRLAAVRCGLRRDREQRGAILVERGLGRLQRLQFHVTVWAPHTAIEADDKRAFLQKLI